MATVRATIAGNAPQPPALAFLRAGRVRARPAVPRPCKAVLRALQASVNPARIPANIAATYPATVCQSFRQHRTRQPPAKTSKAKTETENRRRPRVCAGACARVRVSGSGNVYIYIFLSVIRLSKRKQCLRMLKHKQALLMQA